MGVGALFIIAIGENPIDAYAALFRGAFDGKLRLGTTLAGFTPLLLTSIAFAVAAKAGAFNVVRDIRWKHCCALAISQIYRKRKTYA